MSSQPITFTPPAGSEAQNTAVGVQQTVTTSDEDRPLTLKEYRELQKTEREFEFKKRQKLEVRATKAAEKQAEKIRASGGTVTPDQEQLLRTTALSALDQDEDTETAPAMPGQSQIAGPQPQSTATPSAESIAAVALLKALKLPMVNQDDEEAKMVDLTDGETYLTSIQEAARKKATRLNNPPGSRVPSLGVGAGAASAESYVSEMNILLAPGTWKGNPVQVKRLDELREKLHELNK